MKPDRLQAQELQQILDAIAGEEIPETMNLWQDIRDRVTVPAAQPVRPVLRLSKVVLLLGILLIASTAAYAVYQAAQHGGDQGIMGVSEANLITDLNLTQTLEDADVNITLKWAYADGHRIALGWEVDHAEGLGVPFPNAIRLFDREGNEFGPADFLRGGGGGGGGGGGRIIFGSTASFDATGIGDNPAELNLRAMLEFTSDNLPTEITGVGGSGGSGGGGAGSGSDDSNAVSPTALPEPVRIAPFTIEYEFTVPFIPAIRVTGTQQVETSGVTMTLSNLSYAPSVTLGQLCFNSPEVGKRWYPIIQMQVGDLVMDTGGFYPPDDLTFERLAELEEVCGELVILAPLKVQADTVTLRIDRLQTDFVLTPERLDAFRQALIDAGIDFELFELEPGESGVDLKGEGPYTMFLDNRTVLQIRQMPDLAGETDPYSQVYRLIDDSLRDVLPGPWGFTLDLKSDES